MRTALALCLILLGGSVSPAAALDIHNDNGGSIHRYVMRYEAASRPIRILGPCASACTIALQYPDTCVGPRAVLTFHAARGTEGRQFTDWLRRHYPTAIRAWVASQGGLTGKLIKLRGAALRKRVRACT